MIENQWAVRHITDSAQRILRQIPARAGDRGLHVVNPESILMMALWSLLQWERKVGRVALERVGADPFDLARDLDRLLVQKADEHPVAVTEQGVLIFVNAGQPYAYWDFETLVEPLLQQAEHEALALGHNYVGSEHLVLAIVRLADPVLADLLRNHSVDYARVREAIVALLGSRDG